MKKFLVTGSLAFDFIMDFPGNFSDHIDPEKLHILNISFLVDNLKKQRGGTAGNIAFNLALLNNHASILGFAGQDFGDYEIFLREVGVDTDKIVIRDDDFTSQANVITDKKDNQITAFYPGAMKFTKQLSLKSLKEKPDFCVVAPNDPEAMLKFVMECKELKVPFMFDPGMQLPRLSDENIKDGIDGSEILIGNDYEIGIIKKRLKIDDADILKRTKILVTTLGENGSEIRKEQKTISVESARPFKILDPTGAGDAYRAGFLAGYLRCFDLKTCGQIGSVTACYAVENYGTTSHKFSIEEFQKRYQENFKEELNLNG